MSFQAAAHGYLTTYEKGKPWKGQVIIFHDRKETPEEAFRAVMEAIRLKLLESPHLVGRFEIEKFEIGYFPSAEEILK